MKWFKVFQRSSQISKDAGAICNETFNEAAGVVKMMIVEPDIKSAYVASTPVGAGKLIKITAAGVYDLEMIGKAFSASVSYKKGNVVVEAGKVYVCDIPENKVALGSFNSEQWTCVADAVISGIPNSAGDVVSTGRWHNAISVAGFVVEDDSEIGLSRVQ